MASIVPRPGNVVIFHHSGEGLTADEPHDIPAMVLAVSGGSVDNDQAPVDADRQTGGGPVGAEPTTLTLELFRLRSKEWRRNVYEGEGAGQWSWPGGESND